MTKIETKADLKVGKHYRTTDEFFKVDYIIDGEPYGSTYHIFQAEPIVVTHCPVGHYVEVGCIEVFEEEYEETFQRIFSKK